MKIPNRKVLIIGQSIQSFLAIIRSLGRKGLDVHVTWCPTDAPALRSKYITRVHQLPRYSPTDDAWKTALIELCHQEDFDLVIPCHDSSIIPLQQHREELLPHANILLLQPEHFDIAYNKALTHDAARTLGISVPRQLTVEYFDEVDTVMATFSFPVVLKPRISVTMQNLSHRYETHKVYTNDELHQELESLLQYGHVLVQEHFTGAGVGVEILAEQGRILFAFQHIRLHEKIGGGPSCYRKSSPVFPELFEATSALMQHIGYTGVAMVEFRMDLRTNTWVLLEINGRFWGSLPLAVAAGADFPWYLYQMIVEGRRDFSGEPYQHDIYCRNPILDAAWLVENFKVDRSDPSSCGLPFPVVLKELWNLLRGRERLDSITLDDPMPGLKQIYDVLSRLLRGKSPEIPWT